MDRLIKQFVSSGAAYQFMLRMVDFHKMDMAEIVSEAQSNPEAFRNTVWFMMNYTNTTDQLLNTIVNIIGQRMIVSDLDLLCAELAKYVLAVHKREEIQN